MQLPHMFPVMHPMMGMGMNPMMGMGMGMGMPGPMMGMGRDWGTGGPMPPNMGTGGPGGRDDDSADERREQEQNDKRRLSTTYKYLGGPKGGLLTIRNRSDFNDFAILNTNCRISNIVEMLARCSAIFEQIRKVRDVFRNFRPSL